MSVLSGVSFVLGRLLRVRQRTSYRRKIPAGIGETAEVRTVGELEVAQPLRQHPRARPMVSAMRAPEGPRESGLSEMSEGEVATRVPGRDARSSSGGKDARFGIVPAVLPRRREVHVHSVRSGEEQEVVP